MAFPRKFTCKPAQVRLVLSSPNPKPLRPEEQERYAVKPPCSPCAKQDALAGRVALVTGGGSGIGFEALRKSFRLHALGLQNLKVRNRKPDVGARGPYAIRRCEALWGPVPWISYIALRLRA